MSENIGEQYTIHLSELDEFLASRLLDSENPISLCFSKKDLQGNIFVQQKSCKDKIEEGGVDFELSPSEYQSLDLTNIHDYTRRTVYTSSSYEFFDFVLMYLSTFECLFDFNGNSWRIKITKFKEIERNS